MKVMRKVILVFRQSTWYYPILRMELFDCLLEQHPRHELFVVDVEDGLLVVDICSVYIASTAACYGSKDEPCF